MIALCAQVQANKWEGKGTSQTRAPTRRQPTKAWIGEMLLQKMGTKDQTSGQGNIELESHHSKWAKHTTDECRLQNNNATADPPRGTVNTSMATIDIEEVHSYNEE